MGQELSSRLRKAFAQLEDKKETCDTTFRLFDRLDSPLPPMYIGVSKEGHPSLVVPLAAGVEASARLTHGLAFWATKHVDFEFGGVRWRDPAAVLECRDASLLPTFAVLVSGIAEGLPPAEKPTWPVLSMLFEQWERLLRRRRLMTPEEELGLWGELWLVRSSSSLDALVSAWQRSEPGAVDFVLGGCGFEVKTTRRSGVHFVSQSQIELGYGDLEVYFVVHDVVLDAVLGRSLAELADEVSSRCSDIIVFEQKLLEAGFSRADVSGYTKRFLPVRAPWIFPHEAIPRVRSADPGVSQLRYQVDLDPTRALKTDEFERVACSLGLSTK